MRVTAASRRAATPYRVRHVASIRHASSSSVAGSPAAASPTTSRWPAGRTSLLVEKAQLTAGSTCQAAGLVTAFNPSSTMMRFRRYSIELYERLGVFETRRQPPSGVHPGAARELERTASRARGIGLDVGVIGADEARRLMPAISPDSLYGAVHLAGDGHLDPHGATHAVADAARALGRPDPDGHRGSPGSSCRRAGRDHGRRRPSRPRSRPSSSSTRPGSGRRRSPRWSARSSRRRRSTTSTSR